RGSRSWKNTTWVGGGAGSRIGRSGSALDSNGPVIDQSIPPIPAKAKGAGVVLGQFHELRLDRQLRRRLIQQFNRLFNDFQILQGGAHHKLTQAIIEKDYFRRGQIDTRRGK